MVKQVILHLQTRIFTLRSNIFMLNVTISLSRDAFQKLNINRNVFKKQNFFNIVICIIIFHRNLLTSNQDEKDSNAIRDTRLGDHATFD